MGRFSPNVQYSTTPIDFSGIGAIGDALIERRYRKRQEALDQERRERQQAEDARRAEHDRIAAEDRLLRLREKGIKPSASVDLGDQTTVGSQAGAFSGGIAPFSVERYEQIPGTEMVYDRFESPQAQEAKAEAAARQKRRAILQGQFGQDASLFDVLPAGEARMILKDRQPKEREVPYQYTDEGIAAAVKRQKALNAVRPRTANNHPNAGMSLNAIQDQANDYVARFMGEKNPERRAALAYTAWRQEGGNPGIGADMKAYTAFAAASQRIAARASSSNEFSRMAVNIPSVPRTDTAVARPSPVPEPVPDAEPDEDDDDIDFDKLRQEYDSVRKAKR